MIEQYPIIYCHISQKKLEELGIEEIYLEKINFFNRTNLINCIERRGILISYLITGNIEDTMVKFHKFHNIDNNNIFNKYFNISIDKLSKQILKNHLKKQSIITRIYHHKFLKVFKRSKNSQKLVNTIEYMIEEQQTALSKATYQVIYNRRLNDFLEIKTKKLKTDSQITKFDILLGLKPQA